MSFIAAFGGQACGTCDEGIIQGEEVEYDGTNRLVHVICPETLDMLNPREPICSGCFMELPVSGVCGFC